MSWIDKVDSGLTITTGDGRLFNPKWVKTSFSREYNVTEYNFPDTTGTLVKRTTPLGVKYTMEIYFEGDDHLDVSEQFRISADDRRPWTIEHPDYGTVAVQPASLSFDNSSYNSTKISGVVTETLNDEGLQIVEVPLDLILGYDLDGFEISAEALAQTPDPDTFRMAQNSSSFYNSGKLSITDPIQAEQYFSAFSAANGAIANAVQQPLNAARELQRLIEAPAQFSISVRQRIDILTNQLNLLLTTISTVSSVFDKALIENNGAATISAMCVSAATPLNENDYGSADSVFQIIDIILDNYNAYASSLDSIQTDNGGAPESFVPNFNLQTVLSDNVNYTVSNLFNIALEAKQLREFVLTADSNVILLAHKFYGLTEDDSTIDQFIAQNNIGINDLLTIQAGKTVVYYV